MNKISKSKYRSKIEKLISELCPKGVEFKTLGEVASYRRGSFPQPYGESRWYNGENSMPFVQVADVGENMRLVENTKSKISKLAQPKSVFVPAETVIVTLQGSIGRVAITQYDSYVDRTLAIFESFKTEINKKYFAFQLESKFGLEKGNARGSTIKTITKEEFTKFKIPVPPLAIQEEIVTILNKFTELDTELDTELEARKKQHVCYQDELFKFNDEVSWTTLNKVADIGTGGSNTNEGLAEGLYPFFVRSQVVRYKNSYEFDETAIITSGDGVGVGKIFHFVEGKYALHQRAYRFHITDNRLNPKFLFFYLKNTFGKYILGSVVRSSVTSVRRPMLERYPVPILSLEEQKRIVVILDKFDALVNDISIGLLAELSARRSQYEYYRNKLLSFKEYVQ
ncbi:MAG: restriction endonuclease subunit S [Candidatus Daviesbacteria bacterium]|nr:restriction endonuclease subunit S [Candidatus Daviesbacteria bacterium]